MLCIICYDLNLPEVVRIGNEKVSYIYTSSGEKLATQVGSSLTYYRGPLVYSGNNLLYLVHPEGLTRKSTIGFVYYYAKRDHLGSTRVLCHASGNTLVADQATGYYPFGLAHGHENLNLNRYLFSSKELQDQSLGGKLLGLYDFGSRFYDPTLGRWFNVDHGDKNDSLRTTAAVKHHGLRCFEECDLGYFGRTNVV